jgi:hypothetical protein
LGSGHAVRQSFGERQQWSEVADPGLVVGVRFPVARDKKQKVCFRPNSVVPERKFEWLLMAPIMARLNGEIDPCGRAHLNACGAPTAQRFALSWRTAATELPAPVTQITAGTPWWRGIDRRVHELPH